MLSNNPVEIDFQAPANDSVRGWRQIPLASYLQDDVQFALKVVF
jgi:hypothetical protein